MKMSHETAEYRAMSDEQLDLTLKDDDQEPVPPALPVGHRAAGDAQRDPQGQAATSPASRRFSANASWPAASEQRRGRGSRSTMAEHEQRSERGKRRVEVGVVTSDKMNKTRRVEIPRLVKHPRYGKYIKRRTICHVHDETERVAHGRHGRDHGDPAAVEDEALAAGAGRHARRRRRPPRRAAAAGGEPDRPTELRAARQPMQLSVGRRVTS